MYSLSPPMDMTIHTLDVRRVHDAAQQRRDEALQLLEEATVAARAEGCPNDVTDPAQIAEWLYQATADDLAHELLTYLALHAHFDAIVSWTQGASSCELAVDMALQLSQPVAKTARMRGLGIDGTIGRRTAESLQGMLATMLGRACSPEQQGSDSTDEDPQPPTWGPASPPIEAPAADPDEGSPADEPSTAD